MSLMKVDRNDFSPRIPSIWEDFFGRDVMDMSNWAKASSVPAVNIEEKPNEFEVALAAPGMQREDFKVEVDNGILSVSSEKEAKHEEQDKEGRYTRREFSYHSFSRSFTLPEAINTEKIEAQYKDGILYIHLPKKEVDKVQAVKQIAIK
jgi:HSP20 family protein